MQVLHTPPRVIGRYGSEYERSFVAIDSVSRDYYERLKFRLKKRNSEYAHQPFLWDSDDESENAPSMDTKNRTRKLMNNENDSPEILPECGGGRIAECYIADDFDKPFVSSGTSKTPVKVEIPHMTTISSPRVGTLQDYMLKDSETQTERIVRPISQNVPFMSYGSGSSGQKKTFNVKSAADIHPSAIRAEGVRKDRLLKSTFKRPSSTPTMTGVRRPDRVSQPLDNAIHLTTIKSLDLPGTEVRQVIRPPNVEVLSRLHPLASGGSHGDGVPRGWTSEYNREYPVYPSSIYARSASLAAGGCRASGVRLTGRNSGQPLHSLAPNYPVLLSSRGSDRRYSNDHYGLAPIVTSDGENRPRIFSARY